MDNDFFTLQSLLTFGGATTATVVISNGIQFITERNPRWLGLAIAQCVSVGTVLLGFVPGGAEIEGAASPSTVFVAVINGFLVFSSAVGITAMAPGDAASGNGLARSVTDDVEDVRGRPRRREFWTNWF